MRILCCLNRDLVSSVALNLLLPTLAEHDVRIGLTEQVGGARAADEEPPGRRELRTAEQTLPLTLLFPLIERAGFPPDGGRFLTFAEVERHRGIPVTPLSKPNAPQSVAMVRELAPDLIISIRYGAILKADIITIPRLGVLNLHAGLLPAYRGVLATFRALMHDEPEIGCTLHYIRDGTIDTGDVVAVARVPVSPDRSLLGHVLALYPPGVGLIADAVARLASGEQLASAQQASSGGAYYTYPTAEEWKDFEHRGWRIATTEDIAQVVRRYLPPG